MYETEVEMAMSNEDLVVIFMSILATVLSFADIRAETRISAFAFPIIVIFLVGWGIVRFRRRPLPKQVHYTRFVYLSHLKTLRFYNLIAIIFQNLLIITRYIKLENVEVRLALIYNYVLLFVFSFLEFTGHITVTDIFQSFPRMEGEDENLYRKKRFQILFGTRFWIWIVITSLISIGVLYLPFSALIIVENRDILLIVSHFVIILISIGIVLYFYYKTMSCEKIKRADMVMKAANYYVDVDLQEQGYKILEEYMEASGENIVIMSKLALMHTQDKNYDKVLELTSKVLAETEEKGFHTPHMISRAHLLRSISLKAKEKYKEAYEEVSQSLKFTPENNAARKLRRDLRKIIKVKEQE